MVGSGFFGGLVEGAKDAKKLNLEAKKIQNETAGLNANLSQWNLGLNPDGSLAKLGPDDPGYNPERGLRTQIMQFLMENMDIEELFKGITKRKDVMPAGSAGPISPTNMPSPTLGSNAPPPVAPGISGIPNPSFGGHPSQHMPTY